MMILSLPIGVGFIMFNSEEHRLVNEKLKRIKVY